MLQWKFLVICECYSCIWFGTVPFINVTFLPFFDLCQLCPLYDLSCVLGVYLVFGCYQKVVHVTSDMYRFLVSFLPLFGSLSALSLIGGKC